MSSIEMRFAAMEAKIAELEAQNELLKMQPFEAITEGLKTASPAEVEPFIRALAARQASGKTPASKAKASKEEKEKKTTNPTGPNEWNVFVASVRNEMAAVKGIVEEDKAKFMKACKEAGITYQGVLKEASRRKAEMEGKEPVPKAPKAKPVKAALVKAATPVKAAPVKAATPVKVKPVEAEVETDVETDSETEEPAEAPKSVCVPSEEDILAATPDYDDAFRAKMKVEAKGNGWEARMFGGKACWLHAAEGDVYGYDGENIIGVYNAENDEFEAAE
jgi:hypothetical protein